MAEIEQNLSIDEKLKLAKIAYRKENLKEAENLNKAILKESPNHAEAIAQLGLIANKVEKRDIAIDLLRKATHLKQNILLDSYTDLGRIYFEAEKYEESYGCFKKCLDIDPNYPHSYNNISVALTRLHRYDEAIKYAKQSLSVSKNSPQSYNNLGVTYMRANMSDESLASYAKAIELMPDYAEAYYNRGVAYKQLSRLDEAIDSYKTALELKPSYKDVYLNLGIAYLCRGNYEEGWEFYEKRYYTNPEPGPEVRYKATKWDGSSLEGKKLLIYREQGFGDSIQFARFLPILNDMGAQVIFKCQSELKELLEANNLKASFIDKTVQDETVEFDIYALLLSLPYFLKIRPDNIPLAEGYIKADPQRVQEYKDKYFNNDKFKIGIFWQGSTDNKSDKKRSMPLEYLERLVDVPNVQLYSIQKGYGAEQLESSSQKDQIIEIGESFNDFTDAAAAIENLDLVIGIDSAFIHVAGAMGKPAWLLLAFEADWRWISGEEKTGWYDSLRLFWQKEANNWDDVINKVIEELQVYV